YCNVVCFFFQAEDGIRDRNVTGVQTCALPIFSSGNTLWLWIERIAFCFTIYEVIIVGVRKMQIDIRKDALLALKTAYERAALYCETGNQDIYRNLTSKIDQVLDNGILNQLDVVQSYKNLKLYMD